MINQKYPKIHELHRLRWEDCGKRDLVGVGGEWRMRGRDGGVENKSEGWGVENKSEGWGEWRTRVRNGGSGGRE